MSDTGKYLGPYRLGGSGGRKCGVYSGDCRELSRVIPDESIDIVFTSPPYNVGIDYEAYSDDLSTEDFWGLQKDWLVEAYRVCRDGARLYAIVGDDMMWRFRPLGESIGWRFHQLLVWAKPNLVGGGCITKDWDTLTEWCLLFHKGKRTPMQAGSFVCTHNWIVEASAQSNFSGHQKKVLPAQMPLRVAYTWLSRTPGEIVYDPFIGSGTTAMAAKMLGRYWLGFELGSDTAQLARDRIRRVQPPLFTIPEPEQTELALDNG